jgi:hypothetical protein
VNFMCVWTWWSVDLLMFSLVCDAFSYSSWNRRHIKSMCTHNLVCLQFARQSGKEVGCFGVQVNCKYTSTLSWAFYFVGKPKWW